MILLDILIKGGRIIDPKANVDKIADILVEEGIVKKIGEDLSCATATVIDAKGLWVAPGFIDLHVHLREPGYTHKETIASGVCAAVHGGFTTVCCMPNTKPVADNNSTISYIINLAKKEGMAKVFPIGSITKGMYGERLSDICGMVKAGAVAISEDEKSVEDSKLMLEALSIAAECDVPVFSHCEDLNISGDGVMNEGERSSELELEGIPSAAEEVIIARDIILSRSAGSRLHICHVSTKGGVQLVREAKARGEKVTAEVCPHHFTLTDEDVDGTDSNFKMHPPLRTRADVKALIEGLCDGTIDVIATDHAPHHEDEKEGDFLTAAYGIIGLETAFSIAFTELYKKGHLNEMQLIEKFTKNPADILKIKSGTLSVGSVCDAVIIDPNKQYVVDVSSFESMGKNSPFDGWRVYGSIEYTLIEGKIAFRNGTENNF